MPQLVVYIDYGAAGWSPAVATVSWLLLSTGPSSPDLSDPQCSSLVASGSGGASGGAVRN